MWRRRLRIPHSLSVDTVHGLTSTSFSDINLVVLDYLINEGFPEAAQKFADEANIYRSPDDSEHIQERVEIRNNILGGRIQPAIEQINELSPEVCKLRFCFYISTC